MLDLVRQKFANHAYLQRLLIATGNAQIMEGNVWYPEGTRTFWGCVRVENEWCGQNRGPSGRGKILMQVRSELIAAQTNTGSKLQRAA